MQTLTVELGDRAYPIHIGPGLLDRADLVLPHLIQKRAVIVTNTTVGPLYLDRFATTLRNAGVQVDSVVLPDVRIGKKVRLRRTIIDKHCCLPDGFSAGLDVDQDLAKGFYVTERQVTLVTPDMLGQRIHRMT